MFAAVTNEKIDGATFKVRRPYFSHANRIWCEYQASKLPRRPDPLTKVGRSTRAAFSKYLDDSPSDDSDVALSESVPCMSASSDTANSRSDPKLPVVEFLTDCSDASQVRILQEPDHIKVLTPFSMTKVNHKLAPGWSNELVMDTHSKRVIVRLVGLI